MVSSTTDFPALLFFKSSDFATLRDAFITRYGPAHSVKQEKLKTRMNVEYLNETLIWQGPTMTIELSKYGSRITDGLASLTKTDYLQELQRAYRQKGKDASKDL